MQNKGQWQEMKVGEIDRPVLGKGEILVEVHAAGLNPIDYKTATSGNPNWTYPHILGVDAAGIIAEIGEGVAGWKIGDRIVYHGDLTKKGGDSSGKRGIAETLD
ncbi:MAG: alcohol dehydrogenase catalytic domain-containing protein [Ectobacillus sp.]